jgi:hypothetical protein
VALGTIESARLALNSFAGLPSAQRMGRNLMAHLRSNLTIRIPAVPWRVWLGRHPPCRRPRCSANAATRSTATTSATSTCRSPPPASAR